MPYHGFYVFYDTNSMFKSQIIIIIITDHVRSTSKGMDALTKWPFYPYPPPRLE